MLAEKNFSVNDEDFKKVNVTGEMKNYAVDIRYSDRIKEGYEKYHTMIWNQSDTLNYWQYNHTDTGYFMMESLNIRTILVRQNSNGENITYNLSGKVESPENGNIYNLSIEGYDEQLSLNTSSNNFAVLEETLTKEGGTQNDDSDNNPVTKIDSVIQIINEERQEHGLSELEQHEDLNNAAKDHTDDMAENEFLSHTGSDSSDFIERIERYNTALNPRGENILVGANNAQQAAQQWFNSEPHYDMILTEGLEYAGAAETKTYWAMVFAN